MRMMAVDYGDVRTGVAFCDVREMLATAYDTVEERYAPKLAEKLAALAKAEKAEQIVVGLPRNMDGSYGYRCDASIPWRELWAPGAPPAAVWAICYRSLPDFRWCTRTSA